MADNATEVKVITRNRKARHNYSIEEDYEAGLVLLGTEVKSLREGKVQLKDAYARFEDHELWLVSAHISKYRDGTHENHEPERPRKLLLHRRELNRLETKVNTAGFTIIPLELYFKGSHVKCKLGLAKGKKLFDKRQDLRQRQHKRDIAREHSRRHSQREYKYSKD